MEYKCYIDEKKELQNIILTYLDDNDEFDLHQILDLVISKQYQTKRHEFQQFLYLLLNIINNHHRKSCFIKKVEEILVLLKELIKQTFSNSEIFHIFKNSKIILLFLFRSKIITFDKYIYMEMNRIDKMNDKSHYLDYFYPEIQKFIQEDKIIEIIHNKSIEQEIKSIENFEEKRTKGENDFYICSLIRQDLVKEFISFINMSKISPSCSINTSIFETNPFLIDKNPTLIEYSAFYGSIQIFQYLQMNKVELTSSLWLYAIHGQNPELIHFLESNKVNPPNEDIEICFIESIRCHHNDFANYFESNFLSKNLNDLKLKDDVISIIFHSNNYAYFPIDFKDNSVFFYLCYYGYYQLVNIFLELNENEIKDEIVLTKCFSFIRKFSIKNEFNSKSIFFNDDI